MNKDVRHEVLTMLIVRATSKWNGVVMYKVYSSFLWSHTVSKTRLPIFVVESI